jgi:hypothetical protein
MVAVVDKLTSEDAKNNKPMEDHLKSVLCKHGTEMKNFIEHLYQFEKIEDNKLINENLKKSYESIH